jgi:sugar porter (SP) family MFS transporter
MFASEIPPIIILAVGIWFIPCSPRWLVEKDKIEKAEKVMRYLDPSGDVQEQINSIKDSLNQESGKFSELLTPGIRKSLIVAAFVVIFQQITGASTVIFYAPTILKQAGIVENSGAIATSIILYTFIIVFTLVAISLVDKLGRRPLLIMGALGMAVGNIVLGITFHCSLAPTITVLCMVLTVGAYTMSFAPLRWLVMSEVFPNLIRARAMAVCTIMLQVISLLVNRYFPVVRDYCLEVFNSVGPTFWLFAFICLLAGLFFYKIVPETKGKTFEEISNFWVTKK